MKRFTPPAICLAMNKPQNSESSNDVDITTWTDGIDGKSKTDGKPVKN